MAKSRTDYKVCPLCGAALDVGEACDCNDEYSKGYKRGQEDGSRLRYDKYLLGRTQLYRYGYAAGNADARKAAQA